MRQNGEKRQYGRDMEIYEMVVVDIDANTKEESRCECTKDREAGLYGRAVE